MTTPFSVLMPPADIDPNLSAYLTQMFGTLEELLADRILIEEVRREPAKYTNGDVVYIPIVDANFDSSPGWYGMHDGTWVKLG